MKFIEVKLNQTLSDSSKIRYIHTQSLMKRQRGRRLKHREERHNSRRKLNVEAWNTDDAGELSVLVAGDDDNMLHTALSFLRNAELALCSLTNRRFHRVAKRCMDLLADGDMAFLRACTYNNLPAVLYLLQNTRTDPSAMDNYTLRWACLRGHIEVVRHLLQDECVDPAAMDNASIRIACKNGHYEIVCLLLQDERVDPSANRTYALDSAISSGWHNIVDALLQDRRVYISENHYYALLNAYVENYIDVFRVLSKIGRAKKI